MDALKSLFGSRAARKKLDDEMKRRVEEYSRQHAEKVDTIVERLSNEPEEIQAIVGDMTSRHSDWLKLSIYDLIDAMIEDRMSRAGKTGEGG